MAISLVRPVLNDLFAPEEVTLRDGKYLIDSVLCISDHRALLWGRQPQFERWLLIEQINDLPDDQAAGAVQRAPQLLALGHENLAQVIDVFREGASLYTVMVAGPGTTMAQFMMLSPMRAVEYGVQICNGLNYLHRQSEAIVCGAISPDAVFITTHDRVRLTHMGELLGVNDVDSAFAPTPCALTCAEVFSVGATLHHVLTGWQGLYREGAPSLATLRHDIAPELDAVISQALAQDPAQRWQTSAELRYALLRLQK